MYGTYCDNELEDGGETRPLVDVSDLDLGRSCCSSGDARPSCDVRGPARASDVAVEVPNHI